MRIAVSGTHSMGKSTLVSDFAAAHPDYKIEGEPYRMLRDKINIPLAEAATQAGNTAMLEFSIERAALYKKGDKVIFDRAPVDMLAYSIYAREQGQSDINDAYLQQMISRANYSMQFFDIIVFLPMTRLYPIALENDGIRPIQPQYQIDVDIIFKNIYTYKKYDVFPPGATPKIIELWGTREQRVVKLLQYLT